jgi:hypothetical protein
MPGLELSPADKGFKVPSDFRLLTQSRDIDFAGLVIDPGNKILKTLVRLRGQLTAYIGEDAAEDSVSPRVS